MDAPVYAPADHFPACRKSMADFQIVTVDDLVNSVTSQLQRINADPAIQKCFQTNARDPAGAFAIARQLPDICSDMDMYWYSDLQPGAQGAWNLIAHFYMTSQRWHEAIAIHESLYRHLLRFQTIKNTWLHKGLPLVKISDCYLQLNYTVLAKRYFMYTLCEDAINYKGARVDCSGIYARISGYVISEELVSEYHESGYRHSIDLGDAAWFPERLLAELDPRHLRWMTEYPTAQEYGLYRTNPIYIRLLLNQLGTDSGISLERLAHYLVSMIPGTRVYRRRRTPSSDHDVVGSFEGPGLDFRSELGRYFLCECKDWEKPADVTVIAKAAYFLDSVKSQFGILFSKTGISGDTMMKYAEHELLRAYASRGIAIVVIDLDDLNGLAKGDNFLSLLRVKYEKIRLDIAD
jgi:hypothetical protein